MVPGTLLGQQTFDSSQKVQWLTQGKNEQRGIRLLWISSRREKAGVKFPCLNWAET